MDTSIKIRLKEKIGLNLVLRDNAVSLFDMVDSSPKCSFEMDFKDVQSISRSFADEYTKRKESSNKRIMERNVPSNVSKMFEIVTRNSKSKRFVDLDNAELISI